ncbi:hypothetical protein [uncultured Shewanella sp.]|uniref:hypothetical protein n=1 Tax=uncultured Shewanella sp. TaxID=173975 RepID=UPI002613A9AA|nr:hypothetical protein [uncultured Shewanella sp.]
MMSNDLSIAVTLTLEIAIFSQKILNALSLLLFLSASTQVIHSLIQCRSEKHLVIEGRL